MAAIPAKCGKCSFIFASGIVASGVRSLTLSSNRQNCPRCGAMANLVDGTFDVGRGAAGPFKQTAGAPVDPALFAHIGLILIEAQAAGEPPQKIIERVEPHAPGIAQRLRAVMDDPVAFATVIAATIAGFSAVAVAVISSAGQPPAPTSIQIDVHTEGSFDRERENLNRLRHHNGEMPLWTRDYLEPNKT